MMEKVSRVSLVPHTRHTDHGFLEVALILHAIGGV
jgi:hypothetical protein